MQPIDHTGKRFGHLSVVAFAYSIKTGKGARRMWKCRCDCGIITFISAANLTSGNSTACGCTRLEKSQTHKMSKTIEYRVWIDMHARCGNPKHKRFADWGGRGIKVSDRWNSFENFFADMGRRPSAKHSIDRRLNNGNYELENCRWATRSQQQQNKRPYKKRRGNKSGDNSGGALRELQKIAIPSRD